MPDETAATSRYRPGKFEELACVECEQDVWDQRLHDKWHDDGCPPERRRLLGKVANDGD